MLLFLEHLAEDLGDLREVFQVGYNLKEQKRLREMVILYWLNLR